MERLQSRQGLFQIRSSYVKVQNLQTFSKMKFWCYLACFGCFCVISVRCQAVPCTTPNGEQAICMSLFSCPVLRTAVSVKNLTVEKFIQESAVICNHGTLLVCCGSYGTYTNLNNTKASKESCKNAPASPESKREYAIRKLLPSKKYCGMQHSDDYFHDYNTSETTVDELPWIMYVSCDNGAGGLSSSITPHSTYASTSRGCDCSGILISNRYVLTQSNCDLANYVGLGQREQYRNISCTPTPYGEDCWESPEIRLEETIQHPDTSLRLIRLREKISFTDYVRPICLPLEESDWFNNEDTLISSRWKDDPKVRGFARFKINHTITTNDMCYENFQTFDLEDSPKYMCSELENKQAVLCQTDSGSGMMYKRNNNWFVGGILYGEVCLEVHAVSTRLTPAIVDWILENMKL